MTDATLGSPAVPVKKKRSGCATCAIGCGALILLIIVAFFGTGYWLTKEGEFEAESTILQPDSEFLVEVYVTKQDELLIDFLTQLSTQANSQNPLMRQFPFLQRMSQKGSRKDFEKMMPLKVEVTGTVSDNRFRAALGFSLYNNLMDIVYYFVKRTARKHGNYFEHEGSTYVRVDDESDDSKSYFLSLRDSVLFLCNTEEGIQSVLSADAPDMDTHRGFDPLRGVDLEAPIYGFARGPAISPSILKPLDMETHPLAERLSSEMIDHLGFSFHVIDRSALDLQSLIVIRSESDRAQVRELLDAVKLQLESHTAEPRIEVALTDHADGFEMVVGFHELDQVVVQGTSVEF